MKHEDIASYLDATNLKPDASRETIQHLCKEAKENTCAAVCLYPTEVALACKALKGSSVGVATVIGFPSGRFHTASKSAEIEAVAKAGAREVDIVMNYPALLEGDKKTVQEELETLVQNAHHRQLIVKIIVETCYLTEELVLESLRLCENAHADFIKTSTGFGSAGAQTEHIKKWADHRKAIKIKASGGIKTFAEAQAMIRAGADRLGVSSASRILQEAAGEVVPGDSGSGNSSY